MRRRQQRQPLAALPSTRQELWSEKSLRLSELAPLSQYDGHYDSRGLLLHSIRSIGDVAGDEGPQLGGCFGGEQATDRCWVRGPLADYVDRGLG